MVDVVLEPVGRVVTNRVLLLALDWLSREETKLHEAGELLECARHVAAELGVGAGPGPVQGYYDDSPRLAEYFQLMRALQDQPKRARRTVEALPEFRRLVDVSSAPIYGFARANTRKLLPRRMDALTAALTGAHNWQVDPIMRAAFREAETNGDISLVGLAALANDAVALTAVRESALLYAELGVLSRSVAPPGYSWHVSPEIEHRAVAFVQSFNALYDADLPLPAPGAAERLYGAAEQNHVIGRCVMIGTKPWGWRRHYHWAIQATPTGTLGVHDFWDHDLWTTERYRQDSP